MRGHLGRRAGCLSAWVGAALLAAAPSLSASPQLSPWSASSLENDSRRKDAAVARLTTKVETVNPAACDPAAGKRARLAPIDAGGAQKGGRERLASESYARTLDLYAGDNRAAGIDALRALDDRVLAGALATLNRAPADARAPWAPSRFALGVMLHTETALQASDPLQVRRHLQIAADVLHVAAKCAPTELSGLAPRWYVAVSRVLRDRGTTDAVQSADELLAVGRARLDGSAAIQFESGTLAEAFATTWLTSAADLRLAWTNDDQRIMRRLRERRAEQLGNASRWLSRAIALQPDHVEARLHLGRVRALAFDDDEALTTLNGLLQPTTEASLAYLAGVFIAAVHDRNGRPDQAIAAYRGALERWPLGHAARIGLADALRRAGQTDEARAELLAFVAPAAARDRREPLWWHLLEPPGEAEARIDALVREVRR